MTQPAARHPAPAAVAARGKAAPALFHRFLARRPENTRAAYARALARFFAWSEEQGLRDVAALESRHVAAWIAEHPGSPATVKQHLAAVRALFSTFVAAGVLPYSPAASVRAPRVDPSPGRTLVLTSAELTALIDQIPLHQDSGLRDRALIAALLFAFARISEALVMNVEDYLIDHEHAAFRLRGKDGRARTVPAHPLAEAFVEPYLARIHERFGAVPKAPLFRTVDRRRNLTVNRMTRNDALYMLRRRARAARLPTPVTTSALRAAGMALFLANGGSLETAQRLAGCADSRAIRHTPSGMSTISPQEIARIRL